MQRPIPCTLSICLLMHSQAQKQRLIPCTHRHKNSGCHPFIHSQHLSAHALTGKKAAAAAKKEGAGVNAGSGEGASSAGEGGGEGAAGANGGVNASGQWVWSGCVIAHMLVGVVGMCDSTHVSGCGRDM